MILYSDHNKSQKIQGKT